ncbi:carboxypeptidase-like regulatory domain-containing protein [Bacteroidota bacterium]
MRTIFKLKTGIIILLLVLTFIKEKCYGQEFFKIEGKITNSKNQAIPYVNISIKKTSIGTMSNDDGEFILSISEEYINDTVLVSHIGYLTQNFIVDKKNLNNHKIELSEASYSLKEVSVRPIDPFSILQKAISQITQNYYNTEYESEAFYREVIMENDSYIEYAEGILTIFQKPYSKDIKKQEKDLIRVIESRRNKNNLKEYELSKKVRNPIGGPVTCLKYNPIKFHPSFMRTNSNEKYNYKLVDILEYSGRNLYVIEFDQNDKIKKSLYKGKIYIDKETLAFIHLNYYKSPKGIKYSLPGGLAKAVLKMFKISMEGFDRRVIVNYKLFNGKWCLSSINYKEKASFIKKEIPFDIISTKDLLVSQINHKIENSYTKNEVLKSGEFKDQVGEYNENFWGNYNVIPINKELKKQILKK